MTSPKQVQINFNPSEDFRRDLHGKQVLNRGVLSKKPEKFNPQLVKHKSEVEDLASQFPKTPTPKYRIKEEVFAMQPSVKGATWCNVVTSAVDDRDRALTIKGIKSAILDMKCEVCRLRIYVCVGVGVRVCGCVCVWMHVFMLVCCNL